jgi:5-methyltetrahydropteroyltriglutamate--homocysteine methyltransferase
LLRSTNHSSFPKLGESPLDQQLRAVLKRHERGAATDAEVAEVRDEVTAISVAQMSRAFIDIVTDGMIGWEGPLSHLALQLKGLGRAELFRWFETNFYDRRVEVTGPIERPGPFLVHDYKVAEGVAHAQTVKQVLPGPVTFARLARDRHYGSVASVAEALAAALAEEVRELASAGATWYQLDEPLLCRHPEDVDLVASTARRIFDAAGEGATTILSTYFGDLSASADRLDRLPGTHLGLDMVAGPANYDLLGKLPAGHGVSLGLFDARTTLQEAAADVAALLEPHREMLVQRDVLVGPNAGLELLPRDQAFDKLLHARYLVEKLSKEWTWAS